MILIEDFREDKDKDTEEDVEDASTDLESLRMKNENPLAQYEAVEDDETAGD